MRDAKRVRRGWSGERLEKTTHSIWKSSRGVLVSTRRCNLNKRMKLRMVISAKPLSIHVSLVRLLFELRGGSSAPFHDGRDMVGSSVSKWNTVIHLLGR
jgi:hypothetical protein